MALTTVNTDGITDGTIKNIDVKSDAAIDGSKINPDFGSQNIVTTGNTGIGAAPTTGYQLQVTGQSGYDDIARITAVGTNMGPRINLTPTGTGISRINATANNLALQTGGTTGLTIDTSGNTISSGELFADDHLWMVDQLRHTGDTNTAIRFPAADTITAETAGGERLRITSAGIISINDNTPETFATLQVKNHTTHDHASLLLHGADLAQILLRDDTGGTNEKIITIRNDEGVFLVGTHNDAYSNWQEKFRITNSGNCGLGTATTSGALLSIETPSGTSGNNTTKRGLRVKDGGYADGQLIDCQDSIGDSVFAVLGTLDTKIYDNHKLLIGNGDDLQIYHDGTNTFFQNHTTGAVIHRARTNWQLAVNATDGGADDAIKALQNGAVELYYDNEIRISTTDSGALIEKNANGSEANPHLEIYGLGYRAYHWLDGTAYYLGQNSNNRELRIYSGSDETSGAQLSHGGTSWTTFSDERLKEDIKDIGSVIDKVKDIRCISYKRKNLEGARETIGFIAQDFVGKFDQVLDQSKLKDDDTEEYYGIKYTETIPILLKAIQELSAEIETLKTEVAALKAK